MATIKQLKIGNTSYDIKALNASNQNQANAVVRDIQYGTANPSGGNAGQIYLQYNNSTVNNPYIYAEDTIVNSQNATDLYYSKSEIDNMFAALQITPYSYNTTLPSGNTSRQNYTWNITGNGYVIASISQMLVGNGTYGTIRCGIDYKPPEGTTIALAESQDRNISQGSGQYEHRVSASANYIAENGGYFQLFASGSNTDASQRLVRMQLLAIGCTLTRA